MKELIKKIINKVKGFFKGIKDFFKELYAKIDAWLKLYVTKHKYTFVALGLAAFMFIVDMTAGTRFNAFFMPVMMGFLMYSVSQEEKQEKKVKELEIAKAKVVKSSARKK